MWGLLVMGGETLAPQDSVQTNLPFPSWSHRTWRPSSGIPPGKTGAKVVFTLVREASVR